MPVEDTQADMQADTHAWAPLADVAAATGVSLDTIRRRMRKGEIEGRREQTPQGFRWLARLPAPEERQNASNASESPESDETANHDVDVLYHQHDELIETLRHELALRNREISRLHEVIASQAIALQHQTQALAASTAPAAAAPPAPSPTANAQPEPVPIEAEPESPSPVPIPAGEKPSPSAWMRFLAFLRGSDA